MGKRLVFDALRDLVDPRDSATYCVYLICIKGIAHLHYRGMEAHFETLGNCFEALSGMLWWGER